MTQDSDTSAVPLPATGKRNSTGGVVLAGHQRAVAAVLNASGRA
jgi:hypothetical protein